MATQPTMFPLPALHRETVVSFNPTYTRERKLEILRRILVGGEAAASIARELGLDEKLLSRWRREYVRDPDGAFSHRSRLPAETP
jgi:transposase-like protein